MALATAADYKLRHGITDTSSDALITEKIADATAQMEMLCDRRFESATVTNEAGAGLGMSYLIVSRAPVTSVSAISVRTGAATYTALGTSAYEIRGDGDAGIVDRVDGGIFDSWDSWGRASFGGIRGDVERNTYRITYTGGYLAGTHDTELQALKAIVLDIVSAYDPVNAGTMAARSTLTAESQGYRSKTYRDMATIVSSFSERLGPFKRLSL